MGWKWPNLQKILARLDFEYFCSCFRSPFRSTDGWLNESQSKQMGKGFAPPARKQVRCGWSEHRGDGYVRWCFLGLINGALAFEKNGTSLKSRTFTHVFSSSEVFRLWCHHFVRFIGAWKVYSWLFYVIYFGKVGVWVCIFSLPFLIHTPLLQALSSSSHFYADFTPLAGFPKSDISGTSKSSGLHHCVTCWHPAFERHHHKVIWWFGVRVRTQIAGMCSDPERRKGTLHPKGFWFLQVSAGHWFLPWPLANALKASCTLSLKCRAGGEV